MPSIRRISRIAPQVGSDAPLRSGDPGNILIVIGEHNPGQLQPTLISQQAAHMLSSRQRRADVSEMAHLSRSCSEARACLADLGTLPLAVITSSEHIPGHAPGSPASQKRSRWYTTTWSVLQAEFADLSRDSSHTVAERAGHYIHRDDPDLVIGILRDLAHRAGELD